MPQAPASTRAGSPPGRATTLVSALLGGALLLTGWCTLHCWRSLLIQGGGPAHWTLLALATPSVPLLVLALVRLHRRPPATAPLLRLACVVGVGAWLGYLLTWGTFDRLQVELVLAAATAVLAVAVLLLPGRDRGLPRPARIAEVVLFQLAAVALLAELGLRAVAWVAPSPVLARSLAGAGDRIRAFAFAPGQIRFGFPCNSRGFYDAEFRPRPRRTQPAVAVIGDSFSASVVSHRLHYTTVCEAALPGVEIWNAGWPAMGPEEYLHLLQHEVLPLQPEAVVVALFLGNDLAETPPLRTTDRWLAGWFDRGNVLLLELPRRLLRVARAGTAPTRLSASVAEPAWLADPAIEPGTFDSETWLELQTGRALAAGPAVDHARRLAALRDDLLAMRALAGTVPLGILLIPDEFMVEDALWDALVARAPELHGHRFRLRDELVALCAETGIPCLDLLPALQAVPPLADGDRHLYLRRDSHWNARGNAVAGKALAPFVDALLR